MTRQFIINQVSTREVYDKALPCYARPARYCPHCNAPMKDSDVIDEYTDYTCDMLVKCHSCGKLHTYSV